MTDRSPASAAPNIVLVPRSGPTLFGEDRRSGSRIGHVLAPIIVAVSAALGTALLLWAAIVAPVGMSGILHV